MFLKRAVLINWGNIPHIELDFGPVNLFSGGNGSGKTTAADAIQALLTAAHENLFAFNPGQDETTQKGRGGKQVRTLASYLMGCDDGSYARLNPTDGYIAGVFLPTEGEDAEPFTAVMAMRGHLEKAGQVQQARLDTLFFILLAGEELALSHFIRQDKGGKYLVPNDRIIPLLKKQFSAASVEVYEKKGAYLRRLYGALRGKKDPVSDREAKHAARTFAGFMAYKPVKSIHDFVAQEILEPKDLGEAIRSVSDLMKTIHEMESNAANIKAAAVTLGQARDLVKEYVEQWIAKVVAEYGLASGQVWQGQQTYLKNKHQLQHNQDQLEQLQSQIQQADAKRQQLHGNIVQLEAQRQGIQALRDKDALEKTIERCEKRLLEHARPLLLQLQQLHHNIDAAGDFLDHIQRSSVAVELPALQSSGFLAASKSVSQNRAAAELDAQQLLNQDWIDLSPMEEILPSVLTWQVEQNQWVQLLYGRGEGNESELPLRDKLLALVEKRNDVRQKLTLDMRKKQQEIQLLKSQQVSYPHYVEQALKAIREQCPAADPKVLCDYVDINDSRWQMAIEGYIGGARFSIIVEREYEAEAIRIVRNIRSERRNNARVIQGVKAERDAQRCDLAKHSIIDLMDFSHSIAEAYLRASYGSVVQVADADGLKSTARGLTADGMGSGNYSLWRCDVSDAELVFGQDARQRALMAKELQYEQLCLSANSAEQDYQQALRLSEIVNRVKPLDMTAQLQEMLAVQRDRHQAEQNLSNLDLSDSQSLEQALGKMRDDYREQEVLGKTFDQSLGGLLQQQKQLQARIQQLATELESIQAQQETAEQAVVAITEVLPRFDVDTALSQTEQTARQDDPGFGEQIRHCQELLQKLERQLYDVVQNHNQHAVDMDQLVYNAGLAELHGQRFFKHMVHLSGVIETLHNRLKNNILVARHRQLSQLKDSFNTAFVTNLCHSIYQAINEGKSILEDLNNELQHHQFGSDRERFYFAMSWVPEYQEYWQFFKAIINMANLGDGTTLFDADLPVKHARTRDRLLGMLLDEDELSAHRELARISDYRNYRRYEIYKQPENKQPIALSQYGTGSGGQLETPAYIIRAAAITSAFRFNEGKSHLRMVMVDEAFSKMDETRSREVIRYLTDSLGLQLIFIMPTSKSGPFLDMISNQFVYTKCPTQNTIGELKTRVLVDRKVCKQEQIAKLWAKHRKTIRHQAMLDFMDEFLEQDVN